MGNLDLSRFREAFRTSQGCAGRPAWDPRLLEKKPAQVVIDGGYTNRDNIMQCAAGGIDLVGSLPDPKERSAAAMKSLGIAAEFAPSEFRILDNGKGLECPAGCQLRPLRKNHNRGDLYQQYQAQGADCVACRYQPQCCPRQPERGRTVSTPEVFRQSFTAPDGRGSDRSHER